MRDNERGAGVLLHEVTAKNHIVEVLGSLVFALFALFV